MVLVIQYLVLRSRDVRRLSFYLLNHDEYTRVRSFTYFPFELKLEVTQLMSEDQVPTVGSTSLTSTRAIDFDRSVLDCPSTRNVSTVITSPAIECLTIEDHISTLFIFRESRDIYSRKICHELVLRSCGFCCSLSSCRSFFCFPPPQEVK